MCLPNGSDAGNVRSAITHAVLCVAAVGCGGRCPRQRDGGLLINRGLPLRRPTAAVMIWRIGRLRGPLWAATALLAVAAVAAQREPANKTLEGAHACARVCDMDPAWRWQQRARQTLPPLPPTRVGRQASPLSSSALRHHPPSWPTTSAADALQAQARSVLLQQKQAFINWDGFAAANNVTGWDAKTNVCTWSGVECSDDASLSNGWSL